MCLRQPVHLASGPIAYFHKPFCIGIGQGIAMRLAKANASVTIVGRNEEAGNQIVKDMSAIATASGEQQPNFRFVKVDAQLISAVKDGSEELIKGHQKLDILVLTQGIASVGGYTPTAEGIDRKLAVHYYGRVAFMKCLLPFMLSTSAQPQVLTVLSAGIHGPYAQYLNDPDLKTNFSIKNAADCAGFYNDIAVDMLSKENPRASFIHHAPGEVRTNWGSEFPWYLRGPLRGLQWLAFRSPEECAEMHFFTLARSECQKGGFHLYSKNSERVNVTNLHAAAAETVWNHTKEVLRSHGVE